MSQVVVDWVQIPEAPRDNRMQDVRVVGLSDRKPALVEEPDGCQLSSTRTPSQAIHKESSLSGGKLQSTTCQCYLSPTDVYCPVKEV